jgi:hypothetical protein
MYRFVSGVVAGKASVNAEHLTDLPDEKRNTEKGNDNLYSTQLENTTGCFPS